MAMIGKWFAMRRLARGDGHLHGLAGHRLHHGPACGRASARRSSSVRLAAGVGRSWRGCCSPWGVLALSWLAVRPRHAGGDRSARRGSPPLPEDSRRASARPAAVSRDASLSPGVLGVHSGDGPRSTSSLVGGALTLTSRADARKTTASATGTPSSLGHGHGPGSSAGCRPT